MFLRVAMDDAVDVSEVHAASPLKFLCTYTIMF
jgi:hypothetical protein